MLASRIFGCANGPRYRGAEASQSWYSGNHGDGCIMVNCDPICLDVNKKVVWKVEVGLHTVPRTGNLKLGCWEVRFYQTEYSVITPPIVPNRAKRIVLTRSQEYAKSCASPNLIYA